MLKKYIFCFFILLIILFFLLKFVNFKENKVTINVYNWGAAMSDGFNGSVDVNEIFTKETGIKINYTTFQNNEEMYTKLSSGKANYDVVFASDYAVSRLIKNNLIKKLNFNNIPNYKFIDAQHKNLDFDPLNEYSVPYMWGVVGIFYNSKYINEKEINWDILWDEKYKDKIFYFDNIRDAFGVVFIKFNKDINTNNPMDWYKAYDELKRQRSLIRGYISDQIYDKLNFEDAYVAPSYCNLDISKIITNPYIKFSVPNQGTNKFVDSACIPVNSCYPLEAEKYINFLCRKDIAFENIKSNGYLSPQVEVNNEMISKDDNYKKLANIKKVWVYKDLDKDTLKIAEELWIKLKISKESGIFEKILFISLMFFLSFFDIFFKICDNLKIMFRDKKKYYKNID